MIKVLFFARIREELDSSGLQLEWSSALADLDALQAALVSRGGEGWAEVLGRPNTIRAINQEVVEGNAEVRDGDEVAFFPPVTGG